MTKNTTLFIIVAMIVVANLTSVSGTTFTIVAPQDVTKEATGVMTHVSDSELGSPTVTPLGTVASYVGPPGNDFPLGKTDVIWSVDNGAVSSTQAVTIRDTTAPTIVVPPDMNVPSTGTVTHVPNIGMATATDLVDSNPKITNDAPPGNDFPLGVNIVIWKACDNSNNCNTGKQTITVKNQVVPLTITAPADMTVVSTGVNTAVNIGSATTSGGVPPVTISNDAPVAGFPVGKTTVTWTATDSVGTNAYSTQLITVTQAHIKLLITNYSPSSLLVEDTAPSNIRFNVTMNQPANVIWMLDGVSTPGKQLTMEDAYRTNIPTIGSHTLTVIVQNGTDSDTKTWNWDVRGTFDISPHPAFVNIGQPTNVTLKASRRCGIELTDNCTGRMPASGVSVLLSGIVNANGVVNDTTGDFVVTINTTNNGTINVTASKSGYLNAYTNITVGIAPVVAPPSNSGGSSSGGSSGGSNSGGSSSGGGGGGGGGTAEPYDNILKYEIQEHDVFTTPVSFKYVTQELGVYEVLVTSTQSDIAALRIEVLKGTSKLVGSPAPGVVYKNINAWIDYKRIKNATMKFKVENSWMSDNRLSSDKIKMSKWDNISMKWTELITSATDSDDTYTYFESQTNSFSSFAISGINALPTFTNTDVQPITAGTTGASPEPIETSAGKHKDSVAFQIVIVAILIAIVFYVLKLKKS